VGSDGKEYLDRFAQLGINHQCVMSIPDTHTAQAFITTDLSDNQISAFHPGALAHSSQNRIPDGLGASLALVGPEGREGMLAHAQRLGELGIPFLFDPGQAMPLLDVNDLNDLAAHARYAAFNDYEASLFCDKTGRDLESLSRQLDAVVVTRGADGATIYRQGHALHIPAAKAHAVIDPTGCGDAFRGGLLHGISNNMDWETSGRLASVMGAMKIEHHGGQRHHASRDQIADRFAESFGYRPW
jgi:adenosine kinase